VHELIDGVLADSGGYSNVGGATDQGTPGISTKRKVTMMAHGYCLSPACDVHGHLTGHLTGGGWVVTPHAPL
jgi:hypothetical protein